MSQAPVLTLKERLDKAMEAYRAGLPQPPKNFEERHQRSRPEIANMANSGTPKPKKKKEDRPFGPKYEPRVPERKSSHSISARGVCGPVYPIEPYVYEPRLRPSATELKMLFRNRMAQVFGPEDRCGPSRSTWARKLVPMAPGAEAEQSGAGLDPKDAFLMALPKGWMMIRNEEGTGFFGSLKITNLSQHVLTYRIRASVADRYRLTPPMGAISKGLHAIVYAETDQDLVLTQDDLIGDVFLVDVIPLTEMFQNLPSLYIFWKCKFAPPFPYPIDVVFPKPKKVKTKRKKIRKEFPMRAPDDMFDYVPESVWFWKTSWFQTAGMALVCLGLFVLAATNLEFGEGHAALSRHGNLF